MFTDGLMRLHQAGKVTNDAKRLFNGVSITTFALGSAELYAWLDGNEEVAFVPVQVVNDPTVIAQNHAFVSINGALSVDLYGQVVADNIDGRQISGVGGHEDFVAGAEMRIDDHSLICLRSTAVSNGVTRSRIVPFLPEGSVVSTPRHHTGVVITEHGSADLSGRTVRERALALAEIAHPDFRDGAPGGGRRPSGDTDPVRHRPAGTGRGHPRAPPAGRRHPVRVASFNVHMGVDGWGRPYDLVAECAALDADILVLQEAWTPDDGSPGTAARVASELGYTVVAEAPLAHARLYAPLDHHHLALGPVVRPGPQDPPARRRALQGPRRLPGPTRPARAVGRGPAGAGAVPRRRGPRRWANCAATRRAVRSLRCTTDLGGARADRARHPHVPHHPSVAGAVPAPGPSAAAAGPARPAGRRHEHVGTAGVLVLQRVAAGRDRPHLAGPPAAQPARPRPGHPRGAGGRRPGGRRHRVRTTAPSS